MAQTKRFHNGVIASTSLPMSPDLSALPFPLPEHIDLRRVVEMAASSAQASAGSGQVAQTLCKLSAVSLQSLRLLALQRTVQGRGEEAIGLFKAVIEFARADSGSISPDDAGAIHVEYARTLAYVDRHDEAVEIFDSVLDGQGVAVPQTLITLALAGKVMSLVALARAEEGLALWDARPAPDALAISPMALSAWWLARARACMGLRLPLEALDGIGKALDEDSDDPQALLAKAAVFLGLQRPMQAVAPLERIFASQPDYVPALVLYGQALAGLGEVAFAVDRFERALQVAPNYAPAYRYLASALSMQQMDDAALVCLRAARELKPDWPHAWLDEAGIRLRRGELARGFEAYEWRDGARFAARQNTHYWNGDEAIENRSILVLSEQGFGDTLQFVRYLPRLAKLAGEVTIEVPAVLWRLIDARAAEWGITVIRHGDTRPECDRFTLLMSLPHALRTRLDSIPAEIPYLIPLAPSEEEADALAAKTANRQAAAQPFRLAASVTPLRVGIVPSGNPHYANDATRSMPLCVLAPVLALEGIDAVLLQPTPRRDDLEWAEMHPSAIRLIGAGGDFADMAARIAELDLVISVDTAVAHLAGALGKPVWIMIPVQPDWRWMNERADSPWYPTATLFRQTGQRDWSGVIGQVCDALRLMRDTLHTERTLLRRSGSRPASRSGMTRSASPNGSDSISRPDVTDGMASREKSAVHRLQSIRQQPIAVPGVTDAATASNPDAVVPWRQRWAQG